VRGEEPENGGNEAQQARKEKSFDGIDRIDGIEVWISPSC
jgi:hypothetical protein